MRSQIFAALIGAASSMASLALPGCSAPGMLLVSRDSSVRERALQELDEQSPETKRKSVPSLISSLRSPEVVVRRLAADSLARIGPAAEDAVPGLIGVLRDEDLEVRSRAVVALGIIGPAASAAVPALIEALKTTFGGVGLELARKKGNRLTAVPIPGRPADLAGIGRDDWIAAIDGRSTEDLSNADAAELLRGPPGSRVEIAIRRMKGAEGSNFEPPVDLVVVRGEIPAARICREAAEALGKIGPSARAALPALREAANETVDQIRLAAQEALSRIESVPAQN